ncbi:MAG: hypothetical protein JRE72_07950 [Deltaproteobacteria bacterium]|jgi:hypothetical protein|nr:hypothetical protein [Deltaproteobacteria bacterium]
MESIRQLSGRLNWRYVFAGVVVWWLVMLVVYSLLSLRVNHLKNRLTKTGIELTTELASLVSLPLLERDSQSIHRLLTEAAGKPGVFYASVVDHRNKVVAFTGTGHLMPNMTPTARSVEKVSIREGGFASHAKIINFVSDITYAGTKIGELFIGLSTPGAIQTRKIFTVVAVASGLLLLLLVILFRYQSIRETLTKTFAVTPSTAKIETDAQGAPIACPLCGTRKPLAATLFKQSNLDPHLKGGLTTQTANVNREAAGSDKSAQTHGGSDDLLWLKRRIILRCAEIIKKLTA